MQFRPMVTPAPMTVLAPMTVPRADLDPRPEHDARPEPHVVLGQWQAVARAEHAR